MTAARAPRLVVGLGNCLAGDDGVGARVAAALGAHPALPRDVEVLEGGTDLLRLAPLLAGRREVLLVDAELGAPAGALRVLLHQALDARRSAHAHRLSAVESLDLLCAVDPALRDTRFGWVLVGVERVRPDAALSHAVAHAVPAAVRAVLALLRRGAAQRDG